MFPFNTASIDLVPLTHLRRHKMKPENKTQSGSNRLYRWLGVALLICLPVIPVSAVTIDQSPLVVQKPLPPNIVLMLDDSGSMAWDYMPDWNYLSSNTGNGPVSAAVNGVYYDPTVVYAPPVKADGTQYPSYTDTFPRAPVNGFNPGNSSDFKNISKYFSPTQYFRYFDYFPASDFSCPNYTQASGTYSGFCYSNYQLNSSVFYSSATDAYYSYKVCSNSNGCNPGTVFKYATGATNEAHYVSSTSCNGITNCVLSSDTSGTAAPKGIKAGDNVANWFAYYHTRILTAKSGLMNAFSSIDPAYRFGFGSISGQDYDYYNGYHNTSSFGAGWIKSNISNNYPFSTSTNDKNYLAEVEKLGDGADGTRKAQFWTWLSKEVPNNGTPLRGALNAVGQYYKTAQPWQSDDAGSPLSCRQSYTILTTDGFWNGDAPSLADDADNDSDNSAGPVFKDANGVNQGYEVKAPYAQESDNAPTLADVAMHYWKNDLRTGLDNDVPTTPTDPAFWQHMTTFTVGLGFDPVGIKPSGLSVSDIFAWANSGKQPSIVTSSAPFSWPTPSADSKNNIADLAHAALNGHGAFFSAKNPQAFEQGIASALAATSARLGAGNAAAVDSATLTVGSSLSFTAKYFTAQWTGQVQAMKADANGKYTVPYWDAATELPAYADRNIETTVLSKQGNSNSASPVAFTTANASQFPASLTDAGITGVIVSMNSMINYLRGDTEYDTTNPGGTLRARKSLIGDIVHSSPIYVPAPNANAFAGRTFTCSTDYATFASDNSTRAPVVYVAANDGMLHAFAANAFTANGVSYAAGQELYAFLPGALLRQTGANSIGRLANPEYGAANKPDGTETIPHQYYNDGELTVANAYINKAWHTVLVGTTGLGNAKAVYALDVTDPSNITVLWERAADDGNSNAGSIGQMTGKPIIAEVPDGNNKSEWVVLMGNGANSGSGTAGLLQFDLQTGDLKVYTTNSTGNNALAAPAVWQANGTDNLSTDAYAGDLDGNVWHFNLSGGSANGSGTSIYVAKDAGGTAQPITAGMSAAYNPNDGSRWIFFGTGRYLNADDVKTVNTQTWYGLRVKAASAATKVVSNTMDRSNLIQRTIDAQVTTANGNISRATSTAAASENMQAYAGWYLDLVDPTGKTSGERIINPSQIIGGYLYVSTLIPSATDLCNPYPSGAIMAVNPFTGANPGVPTQDTNGDGKIDAGDAVDGVYFNGKLTPVAVGGLLVAQTTSTGITVGGLDLKGNTQGGEGAPNSGAFSRLSWREILNQ